MNSPPLLRLGVLAPDTRLAVWQRQALNLLIEGGDIELCTLVLDDSPSMTRSSRDRLRRVFGDRTLWRLYNNGWVGRRAEAIQRVDCSDLLGGVPTIRVHPTLVGRYSQHFPNAAVDELRGYQLDVLLRFGFGILRGDVLNVAKHGIWSFHHDDERVIRGGPPSFWEVADGLSTTGVLLQRLTDRLDAGIPLERATFRTVTYSYARNRDRAALGAVVLPAKAARAVRFSRLSTNNAERERTEAPVRRDPSNRQMIGFLLQQTGRATAARFRGIVRGRKWAIGVVEGHLRAPACEVVRTVNWLPERTRGGYFADPFPQRRDGVIAVLVEEFDERSGSGVISALRRGESGWDLMSGVIAPRVHASYPYLFEVGDDLYRVPETAQANRVQAWRCIEFPTEWTPHGTLLDGVPLLDPTVFWWDDRWWLFGTRRDLDSDTALWAWHARDPFGSWTPHTANPIKIDVRSARPAGTPFLHDGVLFRPAQDCSTGYGAAIVINRIDQLDEDVFTEHTVERIEFQGGPYPTGAHTLSAGGGLVAVDACRRIVDGHRSRREILARLRLR